VADSAKGAAMGGVQQIAFYCTLSSFAKTSNARDFFVAIPTSLKETTAF
jgi:hypothetical protein